MHARLALAALMVAGLFGCSGSSAAIPPASTQRVYNGTASVGDFLTITVNSSAHTIAYVNHSNGDSGTVPYTVNSDGTYALSDPAGNLLTAYEVPQYAMVVQAAKTGPAHNVPSLITAVESGPISLATWEGHTYNYMQFRTAAGGMEVGAVTLDAQGNASGSSYWPFGAQNGQGAFHTLSGLQTNLAQADPSGTFLTIAEQGGGSSYVFGTANGQFMVDTQAGAVLGFAQAASKAFDPSVAGTYNAIYYRKTGASTGQGNVESGAASLSNAGIVIDAAGNVTVKDPQGTTLVQATLTPVADAAYLVGAGKLTNPCFGMFTFRVTTGNSQQDVFMSFQGRAVLFSSFKAPQPFSQSSTYDYIYGVGIH